MHRTLIILLTFLLSISDAQFYQYHNWPIGGHYPNPNYFHYSFPSPQPSYFEARTPGNRQEERIFTDFFTTQTFTLTTTTS